MYLSGCVEQRGAIVGECRRAGIQGFIKLNHVHLGYNPHNVRPPEVMSAIGCFRLPDALWHHSSMGHNQEIQSIRGLIAQHHF